MSMIMVVVMTAMIRVNFQQTAQYLVLMLQHVPATNRSHFPGSYNLRAGRVAQSLWRLATGRMVRGSNPGGGEIFRTCPDRPRGFPGG